MKKFFIGIGVVGIIFLLVSSATAVPQTHSKPLMNQLEKIEAAESLVDTTGVLNDIGPRGLIDLLIQLITLIYQLILEIMDIINSILGLVSLIQALINAIQTLFELINQLIEVIQELLNPQPI